MSTLSILTNGHLQNRSPLCLVTHGYLCGALEQIVDDVKGGAGHPKIIIYNRRKEPVELEKVAFEQLYSEVSQEKDKSRYKDRHLSKAAIDRVIKAMEARFDAKPMMESYDIGYREALSRYHELMMELIENMQNDDDEEAILFILMNI